ncbi:MAG: carboxypeptidase-like regulatory domain-containing protein [Planctomycetota bacterium]
MRSYVAVVAAVAMFLAPCASAAVRAERLELKPGRAVVTVRDSDGTALAKAEVELETKAGKGMRTFIADEEGVCTLDGLDAGLYRLKVANRAYVPFAVSKKAEHDSAMIILPPQKKYAAGEAEEAVKLPSLTTFIIGGAVVVGGILLLLTSGGGGGGGGHTCPEEE